MWALTRALARVILLAIPLPPGRSWQLPRVRMHLVMRDLLTMPWRGNGAAIKRELERCVELRRAMIQAGWFN
jgi:hypothetical protein